MCSCAPLDAGGEGFIAEGAAFTLDAEGFMVPRGRASPVKGPALPGVVAAGGKAEGSPCEGVPSQGKASPEPREGFVTETIDFALDANGFMVPND